MNLPGGSFPVVSPRAGSPALAHAQTGCLAVDLLGNPRSTPCTAGAVELAQ
ncbi:MAG TPA: choice-of-anchor Q domain-containing protein [Kofleriaceae bacterium]